MAYWLYKSEPSVWSWDDQVAAGEAGTYWNGVRNHVARKNLEAMRLGEQGFFYHSNEGKAVVGIVEVIRTYYPDHTDESGRFGMVDLKAVQALPRPVTLEAIKAERRCARWCSSTTRACRCSRSATRNGRWCAGWVGFRWGADEGRRVRRAIVATLAGACLALGLPVDPVSAQKPKVLPKPAVPAKVLTCGALANLRILLAETAGDPAAIKARLADPKADHLGCSQVGRERIVGNAERVVIGGTAYDCLSVKETSLCRWALSGVPAEAP